MWDFKKTSALLYCIGCSILAAGQAAKTPMSSLGIGDYYGNALAHQQGMAGLGISNGSYWYLNNVNPALLIYNRWTVFEGGLLAERRTVRDNTVSERNSDANLNYLALGFPVMRNRWSTALGLSPLSSVNYQFQYEDEVNNSTARTLVQESGTGGINQFYWANGVSLTKNVSVGMRATYLFGSIETLYRNELIAAGQPVTFIPIISEDYYVRDFDFTLGLAYHTDSLFNRRLKFNAGIVYDFQADLSATRSAILRKTSNFQGTIQTDSLVTDVPDQITLPSSIGMGISLGKGDKWLVGADFYYYDYRSFKGFANRPAQTDAAWRLVIGGEFTPDPTALGSYLKRITYRTGASIEKYPYLVNGSAIQDFGINFGLSLPVSRSSSLDFGFRTGRRGSLAENLITENYFKMYMGVTFNDQWFIKRKFD
ncbi:MAG: hypothetical protein MUC38_01865 [Cyclobacteriaceae bacterium]|jgi:hypothetical protein|nr:hypothetical protein [Cyclobacteriaceae bacterium]